MNRLLLFALAVATGALFATTGTVRADAVDALKADLPMPHDAVPSTAHAWRIHAGRTLRQTIEEWATAATYQVVWHASHGFDIEADARFQGDFLTAVKTLFEGYGAADAPLYVDAYPDQHLLVITSARAAGTL